MKKISIAVVVMLPLVALALSAQGRGGPGGAQHPTLGERIAHYDPARRRPSPAVHNGPGQLDYFALFNSGAIDTNLWFMHRGIIEPLLLPPGTSTGPNNGPGVGGVYYVMNGSGTATIGQETAPIKAGDAVPIMLGDMKSFTNTGTEPLEFMIVGIARDMAKKEDMLATPPQRLGGGGGAGRGAAAGR